MVADDAATAAATASAAKQIKKEEMNRKTLLERMNSPIFLFFVFWDAKWSIEVNNYPGICSDSLMPPRIYIISKL